MILVDTSVWIQHFRSGEDRLVDLLLREAVIIHPFVIGELALGSLADRTDVLEDLDSLPCAAVADAEHILDMIETQRLFGTELGYVDVHLLGAALGNAEMRLWTFDRRLRTAAERLAIYFE